MKTTITLPFIPSINGGGIKQEFTWEKFPSPLVG